MILRLRAVAVFLALSAVAAAGRQPLPQASGASYVGGTVRDGDGRPVADAVVTLRVDGSGDQIKVLTDIDGRFAFVRVAEGTYRLEVSRAGFVNGAWGSPAPELPSLPFEIRAGELRTDVSVVIWRQVTVAGRVFSDRGTPVIGAPVRLVRLRPHPRVPGASWYQVWPGGATTDDRGAYRFSAPPGRYTVLVPPPRQLDPREAPVDHIPHVLATGEVPQTYAATFHPATTNAADASFHALRSGETRGDVDVRLVSANGVALQGQVVGAPAFPVGSEVRLVVDSGTLVSVDDALEAGRVPVTAGGRFAVSGVPAGAYRLRMPTPGPTPPWLDARVSVSGGLERVTVNTDSGALFGGRLLFLGEKAPSATDLASVRVTLHPLDAVAIRAPALKLDAALTFQLGPFPAGQYLADATPPRGWSLREVLLDGVDVSRAAFSLSQTVGRDVQFVFVSGVAGVSGRISGSAAASRDLLVVLFPEEFATEPPPAHRGKRRQVSVPTADGAFSFSEVPPGRYVLATVPSSIGVDWQWTETLERLAADGDHLIVGAGQQLVVDLRRRRP